MKRRLLSACVASLLFALAFSACGKSRPAATADAGIGIDANSGDGAELAACLDQPGAPPRPPTDRLPCVLIPPGVRF